MTETEIKYLPIKSLKPNGKNPRKIDPTQFEKLCNNMQNDPHFFSMRPCLVNDTDDGLIVYAGNQRLKAAKKIGLKEVPCIVTKNIPEDIIKKRIILDNLHHGDHDLDMLADLYETQELLDLGMSLEDLQIPEIEEIATEEDDDGNLTPAEDKDAKTKLGDVYELNGHRIICGDSTLPEVVEKVLNGAIPILMVTDPPYGVEYDPAWREKANNGRVAKGKVLNDDKVNWALAWHLFPGAISYIWCASLFLLEVAKSLNDAEFDLKYEIIWKKQHFSIGRGDYHWHHEPCWYAVKKGCDHNWQGSRKESTIWEISNLNCCGKSKEDGEERTSHSTQKPIECMAKPIRNNTAIGEGVYDPFLGSGTTLIAAEQLNRFCYGIELSPAYCDIIVNRWANWMKKNKKHYLIKLNNQTYEI